MNNGASALDPSVIGGLVFAGAVVVAYISLRALRRREWPDAGHVVSLVAQTTAVTAGVRLPILAVAADSLGPFHPEDRIFISLGGVALLLVGLREIYRVFRDRALAPPTA
jgi:hypothetical protein